ncbi:methyltransferase domain-containing protein [Chelatococcus sp. SYSU_G07232]|uniref:Methyltransferase domain-containing protein n=1 Tax=Chelatococcus albus TaxID=3047466 RepID=A0ABT7AKT1_9HYPH|nr:methyltransferase [Chelatococcus sp. SYSU_G07232]MDJ1159715.1 methyltransferase domain-containing protein [Chelatococcus sp. SYSU_G07232]
MHDFFAANRRSWDERAAIHARDTTGAYMVDAFLAGADTLYPIEAAEIGDVAGKRLLHLQCHIGLDTLSLARRGAIVTGVDFSPEAIAAARGFAKRTGLAADFVEANVYDAARRTPGPFDMVYTTWGTIIWLPDIRAWARTIAAVLVPGGSFYFLDTHPQALCLEESDGRLVATYPWRTPDGGPIPFEAETTYTGDPTPLVNRKTFEWMHPVGDILSALVDAGLVIEAVREHERLPYGLFPLMVEAGERLYRLPDGMPAMPLALSIRARKA